MLSFIKFQIAFWKNWASTRARNLTRNLKKKSRSLLKRRTPRERRHNATSVPGPRRTANRKPIPSPRGRSTPPDGASRLVDPVLPVPVSPNRRWQDAYPGGCRRANPLNYGAQPATASSLDLQGQSGGRPDLREPGDRREIQSPRWSIHRRLLGQHDARGD